MPVYCFFLQGFFDSPRLCPYDCAPMPEPRLPVSVELSKLTTRGAEISGQLALSKLLRLEHVLSESSGVADVTLEFYTDEQRRRRITGSVKAELSIFCQRCLGPMPYLVDIEVCVAAVMDEDKAAQLPREIDPVIVVEDMLNLHELVEEELLLSLPFVSFHDEQCAKIVKDDAPEPVAPSDTRRPFEGLGALLNEN